MPLLIVTRGLPGSGKSTWARKTIAERNSGEMIRVNRDDIRRSTFDPEYRQPIHEVEQHVTRIQRSAVRVALQGGLDVIVDDTNLPAKRVREWAALAIVEGAEFREVHFTDVDLDQCILRDSHRSGLEHVGEDVIRGMHQRYLAQGKGKLAPIEVPSAQVDDEPTSAPYTARHGTPLAVMVDIDGTVADHTGVRDPYDPTKYHLDKPVIPIIRLVEELNMNGDIIVFCSGRDDTYRAETLAWIENSIDIEPGQYELHMRPMAKETGPRKRNDAVVKLELFDEHIRDRFTVRFVLDDRDRVVKAWRSIGLTVLQVADGNF